MKLLFGDILNVVDGVIVQQVNCQGVMGAGLAKQIMRRYPEVYDRYLSYCSRFSSAGLLGRIDRIDVTDKVTVVNMFAQHRYGRDKNVVYTDYKVFEECLVKLKEYMDLEINRGRAVFFPWGIGCGLANGDWNIINGLILRYFPEAVIVKKP